MTAHTGFAVSPTGAGAGTTPQGARLAVGGLLAKSGSGPLAVRTGIIFDGGGNVVSGRGSMGYEVRPCTAVVLPSQTQGPVLVPTSATVIVPTDPGPGSNSRIDVIWIRQRLIAADGGSDTTVEPEWGVTKGAVSASPAVPSVPSGAVAVARAVVTAGASTTAGLTITQVHPWTAAVGAPIPVRDDTERGALTPFPGLMVNHLGRNVIERWNGSNWLPPSGAQPTRILQRTNDIPLPSGTNVPLTSAIVTRPGDQGNASGINLSGGTLTISRDGLYYIMVRFVTPRLGATISWTIGISVNGETTFNSDRSDQHSGGVGHIDYVGHVPLQAGDALQVMFRQISGSSATIAAASDPNRWEVRRVGDL